MSVFLLFLRDEAGAINPDWVALTSGLLLLGIAVIYVIYGSSVYDTVGGVNSTLRSTTMAIDTGPAPDLNK